MLSCFAWLLDTSGEIDGDVVESARPDGLGNVSTAETSAWDSNLAELRQPIEGIGVVGLANSDQLYLSRKSVEIRTRNCLRPEGLAFCN